MFAAVSLSASAQGINGSWKGSLELNAAMKLTLVFHFNADASGRKSCTFDSPDQGAMDIPAKVNYLSADSVNVSVESIGATYAGRMKDGRIKGAFSQMGMSFALNLQPGTVEIKRPQTPQAPFPYKAEDVSFSNPKDGATLAGTLVVPDGAKSNCPVVLFVSGSGLQNRDEELFGHKPFLVMADYLARHGIASLRYDDRGFGKSTGNAANATTATFCEDADAGVEWLRQSKRFGHVGVVGHSEGAAIAFMLGARKKADFIVCMAAPAVKGDALLLDQTSTMMKKSGIEQQLTIEQIRQQALAGETNAWMEYFIDYSPASDIMQTACPVMAIYGSNDVQVTPSANLQPMQFMLMKNKKALVKEYKGLNHLFQHCTTGMPNEYGNIEETISPEVLSDIANWVLKQ